MLSGDLQLAPEQVVRLDARFRDRLFEAEIASPRMIARPAAVEARRIRQNGRAFEEIGFDSALRVGEAGCIERAAAISPVAGADESSAAERDLMPPHASL